MLAVAILLGFRRLAAPITAAVQFLELAYQTPFQRRPIHRLRRRRLPLESFAI